MSIFNKKKKNAREAASKRMERIFQGEEQLDFSTREAFNLMRTNITMSFTDAKSTKIIGVTSSVKGEGKTFVGLCLAHALAEDGKKVIVLDCDMRLPTVAKKLGIKKDPGMSTVLTGSADSLEGLVQYGVFGSVDVIPSGNQPPNPSELLGSDRLELIFSILERYYDYILLDLPPVTAVTDALVVSKVVDGIVMVVRNDHVERAALQDAMRQLGNAGAKLLGFVYNGKDYSGGYYRKGYYKRGYYRSKYSRGYGYEYSSRSGQEQK